MNMDCLRSRVNNMVSEQLKRANQHYPPFCDANHGYGVIAEEADEVEEEFELFHEDIRRLLRSCHRDTEQQGMHVDSVRLHAVEMACEAVQVAAMCDKFKQMLEAQNVERG